MSKSPIVAPSVLSADFANLERDVRMLNESAADWIHVDIMDGVFVPNLSMGLPVVEAIQRHAVKPLDVHLMIVKPDRYVQAFRRAGAASISVHIEACRHLHRNIQQIKDLDCKAGVAINPHTSVRDLENIIQDIDLVCVMSVNPGFGGQAFIPAATEKIARIRAMVGARPIDIEVDGGITPETAPQVVAAGANVLVAGSAIFKGGAQAYRGNIAAIRHAGALARGEAA